LDIKITRKLLDEYREIKRKRIIPLLELELEEMKQGDNGFGNSTVYDYRDGYPKPQSVVGFDWDLYEHREKALAVKKAKVQAVEKWISVIEDGQTRCVFKMYYTDGMKWEKIAAKTGYANSPDYPRLHIRDDFLKKCGVK